MSSIYFDPALVEAVAKAIYTEWDRQLFERGAILFRLPWDMAKQVAKERYQLSAVAAIRAVDAHRAEAVRAAVYAFAYAAERLQGDVTGDPDELRAAYDDTFDALLALVGAEETE